MTARLHWGTGIALVYTAFALATVGFVVFAMSRQVDLVSPEYYAQALGHDARMAAKANADALGASLVVDVRPEARAVAIEWPAAIAGDVRGTATLYRPSSAALDRTVPLSPDAEGRQVLALDGLAPGAWRLHLEWTSHSVAYYVERDLVTP
jgi:hypothetical protein